MSELIKIDTSKCVGCNACIRTCPVTEANKTTLKEGSTNSFVTTIQPDKCINCGECIRTCTHGARSYVDDTTKFFDAIRNKRDIVLVVTPAIKVAFKGYWKQLLQWFRRQGVKGIYDVSYGADICTWGHLYALNNQMIGNVITQPCAAIVNYILKYKPEAVKNLSPIHSPIACECIYLQKYLGIKSDIAVLSPCIAKKSEFEDTGVAKYNVTFANIMKYLKENGVTFAKVEHEVDFSFQFDDQQGSLGALYPRPGGLRDNIWARNPDINITTSEGVHKVYPELDLYCKMDEDKHPEIFDVLSCEFGCNTGPASGHDLTIFDIMGTMKDIEKDTRAKRKTSFFNKKADKLFDEFDEMLNIKDFIRVYKTDAIAEEEISNDTLMAVYESMGKTTESERNYNCHACGYKSCKDMAIAIARGLNVADNCIVHAKQALAREHESLYTKHVDVAGLANNVNNYATNLLADIENIYASLTEVKKTNVVSDNYVNKVDTILSQIIDTCGGTDVIDGDLLQQLMKALTILRTSLNLLKTNINVTVSNSNAVEEAMHSVADATTTLNSLVSDMLNRFDDNEAIEKVNFDDYSGKY